MQERDCCVDAIMVVFITTCIAMFLTLVHGFNQFTLLEVQKALTKSPQCQRIFDTQKSEINKMQQEYYNTNCKK